MTPSMGMAAPKGMAAAPQAGLAAIAQPAQAPKGKSSGNMAQVMALARKMSDAQLAEVLQGKSLDVPQYVAMTEAMGRKSLRTAVDGQQAMAQAQQPSIKDKLMMGDQPQMPQGMPMAPQQPVMAADGGLMYADGGIASLSAPNMESMDMASGGIVAFNEGGTSEEEQARKDREALKYGWENTKAAARDILTLPGRGLAGAFETAVTRPVRAMGVDMPYLPSSFYGGDASSLTPHMDTLTRQRESQAASKTTPTVNSTPTQAEIDAIRATAAPSAAPAGGPTQAQRDAFYEKGKAGDGKEKTGLGATDEFKSYMDTVKKNNADYLGKLEGLSAKQREGLASIKSQGGGEALMNLAQGILSKPGLAAGVAAGLPGVAATSAASRKEQRAVENAANDYDLNLAKAQEAAAKGDMESALKFKQLADEASYRNKSLAIQNAQVNKPGESMQLLNALGDPKLMERYKEMQLSKKPTDVISKSDALKAYNDRLEKDIGKKFLKQFPTFDSYYNDLSTKAGSGGVTFLGFE